MHESTFVERVKGGEFKIDKKGRIWRITRPRGGRCIKCGHAIIEKISPKRVDNKLVRDYLIVEFGWHKKIPLKVRAHRAVWTYFNGSIPAGLQVNHKNGVKTDNRPENLSLVTGIENTRHASHVLGINSGENNHSARLKEKDVLEIRKRVASGESKSRMSKEFGVNRSTIKKICDRKAWRHI